jgi:hypothetical protein
LVALLWVIDLMKADLDKEIDLLLRYHARREDRSIPFAQQDINDNDEEHMDADELSTYVENRLPEPTRVRYTNHLSNCGSCRRLVSNLVRSSEVEERPLGFVGEDKQSWYQYLIEMIGTLFNPRILQFVAPILIVGIVAIIGFNIYQNRRYSSETAGSFEAIKTIKEGAGESRDERFFDDKAMNREETQRRRENAASPAEDREEQGAPSALSPPKPQEPSLSKEGSAQSASKLERVDEPKMPDNNPQLDEKRAASSQSVDLSDGRDGKTVDNESTKSKDEASSSERKKEVEELAATAPAPNRPISVERREAIAQPSSVANSPKAESGSGSGNVASRSKAAPAGASASVETRTVAGHQFRKSENGWIDTAYRAQTMVNVKRGSEQYRALIGDEPTLRAIAESLSGEVIVVLKSRAYRIH